MMPMINDTPPRGDALRELRRQIAGRVQQCYRWLCVNGFEVLVVQRKIVQPRIVIKHDQALCDALEGVIDAFERIDQRERRYRYVVRFDVMVEWEIGGAA